jgi:putative lipoprotein
MANIVILAVLLLAILPAATPAIAEDGGFDEASINSIWHEAKLRGVAFRAVGQEPGWLLEISDGAEILLVLDYGESRKSYPFVEPVVYQEERMTRYIIDEGELIIEIRGQHCEDVMSGEQFEVSVTIIMPDRRLAGCGRALY